MKNMKKWISLVLALVLTCGALSGVELPRAAAAQTQSLAQLLNAGAIKPLGRTMAADGKLLTVWSGSGFEMNVFAPAETTLTVGYETTYACMWVVQVDGVQVTRVKKAANTSGTFTATIPYGSHTVSVVQDTQIAKNNSAKSFLTTISMDATLQTRPADKDLYIEFLGDSLSCGDGTMAEYQTGVAWTHPEDDSATHSFPWYTAKALNADYSIVARGGIGLFRDVSVQEGTPNSKNLTDVYPYIAGYNQSYGEYDFTSHEADIVVVQIGGNDGTSTDAKLTSWRTELAALLTLVRQKNPDATIVCMNYDNSKYHVMKELTDSGDYGEAYTYYYGYHGNGSAALATQQKGHPSAADSEEMARGLVNFMRYNNILPQEEQIQQESTYNDVVYYVAEGGSDSNDGLSRDKAKLTVNSALNAAKTSQKTTTGNRVVVKISGTILGFDGQAIGVAITDKNGSKVPVMITTDNYDATQDNKATMQVKYSAATQDGQMAMACQCNLTLQNLRMEAVTNANGWAPYNIYAAGSDLVFDNVEFATDGKATTVQKWNVGGVNFSYGNVESAKTTTMYGSITFLNGDYTNLGVVAAVYKDSVWKSGGNIYALPYYHAKLVIGEDAKMGAIYGRYGRTQVGSATVEINGGEVASYTGTQSGTSSNIRDHYGADKYDSTVETDLNLVINGGKINSLAVTGNYVKLKGDISVTVNAGTWDKNPTMGTNVNLVGNVTNVVGGGTVTSFAGTSGSLTITGDVTNIVNGGTIESFVGMGEITINGNLVNNIHGGVLHKFRGSASSATINGNVDLNMTGGRIEVQHNASTDSIYLSASGTVKGNATNTISGGEIHMYTNNSEKGVSALIMFGGEKLTVNGTLTNKISGGTFAIFKGTAQTETVELYLGSLYSPSTTVLRNELTGGSFYLYKGTFRVGGRGVESVFGKIENVFGVKDQPTRSPRFLNANLYLGGNWGQIGVTTYVTKKENVPTEISDTVVLSNTIYGGYYEKAVYAGHGSITDVSKNRYAFIKGSIENNIYGGTFVGSETSSNGVKVLQGGFYGAAVKCDVLGKVTTNIYGGRFSNFYGAGDSAIIHDGLEINIYGMEDLQFCENNQLLASTPKNPIIFVFDIGNKSAGEIKATTAGRPAIKLTIDGQKPEDVAIYKTMNLTATEAASAPVVEIESGTFPTGLNLTGAAVEDVLAAGSVCFVGEQKVTPEAGATTLSGAVTVKTVPAMIGDTVYESLQEALQDAEAQQEVQLGKSAAVDLLRINSDKKLDINGNVLTASDLLSLGHFVDSSNGKGLLKISNDPSQAVLLLRKDNQQIPIYDAENGGYRFYNRQPESLGSKPVTAGVKEKFGFRLQLPTAADYALLADAEQSGLSIEVTVTVGSRLKLTYEYSPEMVADYARRAAEQLQTDGQVKVAFTLTLSGLNSVKPGEVVTISPRAVTEAGVVMEMTPMTWTAAQ